MRFVFYALMAIAVLTAILIIRFLLRDFGIIGKPKPPEALPNDAPEVLLAGLRARRDSRSPSTELVSDPREAGTILLLEMARASGELNAAQLSRIESMLEVTFGLVSAHASELISQARWVSSDEAGEAAMWRRMALIIVKHIPARQIVEFDELLVEISEFSDAPTSDQLNLLNAFRRHAGIIT